MYRTRSKTEDLIVHYPVSETRRGLDYPLVTQPDAELFSRKIHYIVNVVYYLYYLPEGPDPYKSVSSS